VLVLSLSARQVLRRVVPVKARLAIHRRYEALAERLEGLLRREDPLLPPTRLMFVGGSRRDFRALGDKWLRTFVRLADLKPSDRVLDVGCGVGRMAVALTRFLSSGRYEGFDIVRDGITWCRETLTSRYPQFGFQHADIYNEEYNPGGRLRASEYVFPYPDSSFDFVFLTSVFTHMLPGDVRHYLGEIQRVLAPGGRCLITWFVLDTEAVKRIQQRQTDPLRTFSRDLGGYWVVEGQTPEAAIAYSEADVRELYRFAGLSVREPIVYGAWSGRANPASHHGQDIVVSETVRKG
jgi:SAM-dependent methyltransferase